MQLQQSIENPNLLTDRHTLAAIRAFYAADKEGLGLNPVDAHHVIWCLAHKGEDHSLYPSQQTLARAFITDPKTVQRSQKRCESVGWMSRPQRRGKSCELTIHPEKIPFAEHQPLKITETARTLAGRYQQGLRKHCGRRKFPAGWLNQQHVSAQRILNLCNGELELACRIIGHAVSRKEHQAHARRSLYHLLGRWRKIMGTFEAVYSPAPATATQENE